MATLEQYKKAIADKKMDFFNGIMQDLYKTDSTFKENPSIENLRLYKIAELEFLLNDETMTCYHRIVDDYKNEKKYIDEYSFTINKLKKDLQLAKSELSEQMQIKNIM